MYTEFFKKINGYDNYYISNFGRVISTKFNKIKYLKQSVSAGYYYINICQNGKHKLKHIHRLVAETFIDNPNNHLQVDHIDGDRTNNNIENLRWVTPQGNQHNRRTAKGYYWCKRTNKWKAQIYLNYKNIHLGYFDLEEDARQAYLNAKEIYHVID